MAQFTFFTNPMSRGQIVRWALHETGADYDAMLIDWQDKPAVFLECNPMGKVPTIIHHAPFGDRVEIIAEKEGVNLFAVATRVAKVVQLQPISLEDVKATVASKAEVEIADDVLPEMLRQAEGRMRLLLNAIANIEAWADANGWDKVTLEHIKGRPLCPEFTGKPLGRNRGGLQ